MGGGSLLSLYTHTILVWLPVETKTKHISKATTGLRGRDSKSRTLAKIHETKKTARNLHKTRAKQTTLLFFRFFFFFFCCWHALTWREEKRKCCHWLEGGQDPAREREREYKACQQFMWEYYLDLKTFSSTRSCAEISVLTQMCRKGEALATKWKANELGHPVHRSDLPLAWLINAPVFRGRLGRGGEEKPFPTFSDLSVILTQKKTLGWNGGPRKTFEASLWLWTVSCWTAIVCCYQTNATTNSTAIATANTACFLAESKGGLRLGAGIHDWRVPHMKSLHNWYQLELCEKTHKCQQEVQI